MDMGVDKAGKQSDVAEVDDACVRRNGSVCADRRDAFPIDDNYRVACDSVGCSVEESSRLDDCRLGEGESWNEAQRAKQLFHAPEVSRVRREKRPQPAVAHILGSGCPWL